jgi:hypothetical protein
MAITPLPTPPSRDDPTNFATRADAFLGALPDFATEANALAVDVNADAVAAAASAVDAEDAVTAAEDAVTAAEAAAAGAAAAANVTKWVSGTTYNEGAVVWSPITYLSYRRKSTGGGTTDPSADSTNWAQAAGTGDMTLAGAQTITGTKTFSGTSSTLAVVLNDAAEVATVSATAATGTIAYDITTQSVLFYTSNASANWTVNFRASSGTSLDTALATGQSVTVAFLVTQGATAYYNSAVQVDGTTSGVTTRWLGGAPTAGNASGIDSYRYLIIKTGSATYTVLASVTQFKA